MKELSELTEVSSGTIRYYIKQGLLPEPYKPHKNMAYYDRSYVEKIKLIKDLQENHYLPLHVIKMMLEETGYDEAGAQNWLRQVDTGTWFETKIENNGADTMTRDELIAFAGVTAEDFDAAVGYNMIIPNAKGLFDKENITTTLLATQFRNIGLTEDKGFNVDFLALHYNLLEFLVKKEVDFFVRNILDHEMNSEEVHHIAEKALEIIYKVTPIMHRQFLKRFISEIQSEE